ncbi:nuclear hormone receptor family member nhr-10-like isoform X2 [Paramacrobiotus metropolitanus]|uniref:nuclear hormone receptor family member nhr-10-like isoform X2 n=1 Tax=Paramacrobiotus metropolitanus TaxID=2943436 RepID=UPI0024460BF1|nr:nuclear hormone receptor family member nhr-10-like isoform X2 [Paramacrobiotus metropolitanus]
MEGVDQTNLLSDTGAHDSMQQDRCAVCLEVASGLCCGVLTCIPCKSFFMANWNKTTLTCKGSGQCAVENVRLKSCSKCRLERCLAVGMDKRKSLKHPDRARLEAELLGLRNPQNPTAFAKMAIRAVVRNAHSVDDLEKLLRAVQEEDSAETACVPFPHKFLKVNENEVLSHVLTARIFRWNRVAASKVVSSHNCTVDTSAVCINPYHYCKAGKPGPAGQVCVVASCNNYTGSHANVGFFRLPDRTANEERYLQFFSLCARQDLDKTGFTKHHRICGEHFLESDFVQISGKRRKLNNTALPSQLMPKPIRIAPLRRDNARLGFEKTEEKKNLNSFIAQ